MGATDPLSRSGVSFLSMPNKVNNLAKIWTNSNCLPTLDAFRTLAA